MHVRNWCLRIAAGLILLLLAAPGQTLGEMGVSVARPSHAKFYYGDLVRVDGVSDADRSFAVLSQFDLLVVREPGELRARQRDVADRLVTAGVGVFGYTHVAATLHPKTEAEIQAVIDRAANAGYTGIFFDTAGYDYGVDRARFNRLVEYAHRRSLRVMANAWSPADVLDARPHRLNPNGTPTALGPGDWVLLESFYGRSDDLYAGETEGGFATALARYRAVLSLAGEHGVNVMGLSYQRRGTPPTDTADRTSSYLLARMLGLQGWSHGISDDNDGVPWTTLPTVDRDLSGLGPLVQVSPTRWERASEQTVIWFEASDQPASRSAGVYRICSDGALETRRGWIAPVMD